jgi:large subunit ribosomal protein L10
MNREQKAAAVAEIAESIRQSEAVFAVDFRGISVPQAAELRTRLRDADAAFRVVKNSLTERAADEAGADSLKALLEGPTALTFVRGDAAVAAKALQTFRRETDLLEFKGGLLGAEAVDPEQLLALARLPARDILYGQLVGVVASPISGLVRGLNALIAGLALQLGQIAEKKASGEIPAGEPPAEMVAAAAQAEAPAAEAEAEAPSAEAPAAEAEAPAAEAEAPAAEAEAPAAEADASADAQTPAAEAAEPEAPAAEAEAPAEEAAAEEAPAETATEPAAEPEAQADTPSENDNEADASA